MSDGWTKIQGIAEPYLFFSSPYGEQYVLARFPLDFLLKQPYKYEGNTTDWRVGLFLIEDAGQMSKTRRKAQA